MTDNLLAKIVEIVPFSLFFHHLRVRAPMLERGRHLFHKYMVLPVAEGCFPAQIVKTIGAPARRHQPHVDVFRELGIVAQSASRGKSGQRVQFPRLVGHESLAAAVRVGDGQRHHESRPVVCAVPDPVQEPLVEDVSRQRVVARLKRSRHVEPVVGMSKRVSRCRTLHHEGVVNVERVIVVARDHQERCSRCFRERDLFAQERVHIARPGQFRFFGLFFVKKVDDFNALEHRIPKPFGLPEIVRCRTRYHRDHPAQNPHGNAQHQQSSHTFGSDGANGTTS